MVDSAEETPENFSQFRGKAENMPGEVWKEWEKVYAEKLARYNASSDERKQEKRDFFESRAAGWGSYMWDQDEDGETPAMVTEWNEATFKVNEDIAKAILVFVKFETE